MALQFLEASRPALEPTHLYIRGEGDINWHFRSGKVTGA